MSYTHFINKSFASLKNFLQKGSAYKFLILFACLVLFNVVVKNFMILLLDHQSNIPLILNLSLGVFYNYDWAFGIGSVNETLLSYTLPLSILFIAGYVYIMSLVYFNFSRYTKFWLTFVAGGMLTNLFYQVVDAKVLDFINFKIASLNFYFNTADIMQTVGLVFLIYYIIKNKKLFLRPQEGRQFFTLVFRKAQLELIAYFTITLMIFGLFYITASYFFTKNIISPNSSINDQRLFYIFFGYFASMFIFTIVPVVVIISLHLTKKIYGPIYAFEKHIREFLKDKNANEFKLRKGDHPLLKQIFESLAKDIKKEIK